MKVEGSLTSSRPSSPRSNCIRHSALTMTWRSSILVSCNDRRVVDRQPRLANNCWRLEMAALRSAAWTTRAPLGSAAMNVSANCDASRSASARLVFFSYSLKNVSIASLSGSIAITFVPCRVTRASSCRRQQQREKSSVHSHRTENWPQGCLRCSKKHEPDHVVPYGHRTHHCACEQPDSLQPPELNRGDGPNRKRHEPAHSGRQSERTRTNERHEPTTHPELNDQQRSQDDHESHADRDDSQEDSHGVAAMTLCDSPR